jgi:hypothetical protein
MNRALKFFKEWPHPDFATNVKDSKTIRPIFLIY